MMVLLQKFAAAMVAFGVPGMFLLAVVDSAGVPLPALMDVLVIGAGAANVRSPQHAYLTAFMAVLGSVMGNIFLFLAARQGVRWIARKEQPVVKRRRFREWFGRYGMLAVFVPAVTPFAPLPLKLFVVSAGAMGSSLPRFIAVITVSRAIRYFGEVYLGLALGHDASGFLARNGWTLCGIAVAFCIAVYAYMRHAENQRASQAPGSSEF
jgi:membrane protein YqaA with SNARE-associated domain